MQCSPDTPVLGRKVQAGSPHSSSSSSSVAINALKVAAVAVVLQLQVWCRGIKLQQAPRNQLRLHPLVAGGMGLILTAKTCEGGKRAATPAASSLTSGGMRRMRATLPGIKCPEGTTRSKAAAVIVVGSRHVVHMRTTAAASTGRQR
jgi:hypothetical protein